MARPKSKTSLKELAFNLKTYLENSDQLDLKRNIQFADIPEEDLDILFAYLSVSLICALFGGINRQQQIKAYYARKQQKQAEAAAKKINADDSNFEPYQPAGIGEWQYAERMKQKVFRSLEVILNQKPGTIGHNQYVQAAKTLLEQSEKTKADAAEIMMAYEMQLIILADHLVCNFLPEAGNLIKKELRQAEQKLIDKIQAEESVTDNEKYIEMWSEEIDRVVRSFELKRYELLLAETMASSREVSEAFDFTKDLVDNYKDTESIATDSKETAKLKEFIEKRKNI